MTKKYNSHLVIALEEIKKKFDSFKISQSTAMHDYFLNLAKDEKKNYIAEFEIFYYFIGSFRSIINDMLFLCKNLENIKIERDSYIKRTKKNPPAHFFAEGRFQDIAPLVRYFHNSVTILIKILEDNNILTNKKIKNSYQELHYLRLLRNNFVQHIGLNSGYQKISSSTIPSSSSKELPDFFIGPGGGGWVFYTGYYQETADTKKYKQLSNKGKLTKNKENFIQYSKWLHIIKDKTKKPKGILNKLKYLWYRQKTKNRKDIEAQIKTYGLPKVNQQLLAEDITNLFNDIILDLIKNKIDKAKKNKILF